MIFTFLLEMLYATLSFAFSYLPGGTLPDTLFSAFYYFIHVTTLVNFLLPVDTAFEIALYVASYYGVIVGFAFIMWMMYLIRGK